VEVFRALTNSTLSKPNDPHDRLVGIVTSAFGFLEEKCGRRPIIDGKTSFITVAYVCSSVTIEVELDLRELVSFARICRTVGGKPPPGHEVYRGQVMRVYLHEGLYRLGGDYLSVVRRLRAATTKSGYDAMEEQITLSAEVLEESFDAIVDGLNRVLS
jgi:hypothetical protein